MGLMVKMGVNSGVIIGGEQIENMKNTAEACPTNGLVASFHRCLDPTLSASVDWLSRLQR